MCGHNILGQVLQLIQPHFFLARGFAIALPDIQTANKIKFKACLG